jgi:magnesium-transporting ATPase (P-type)
MVTIQGKDGAEPVTKMSGASQDELNLLKMVEDRGLAKFISKNSQYITIKVLGVEEQYEIIKFFDFSSDRKMMSIVLRNSED